MDYREVDLLRVLLWEHLSSAEFTVSVRGDSLAVVVGTGPDRRKLARLTRLGQERWAVSLPNSRGTWVKTPHVGQMEEMVRKLARDAPPPATARPPFPLAGRG